MQCDIAEKGNLFPYQMEKFVVIFVN
jgi:hypothetical protein